MKKILLSSIFIATALASATALAKNYIASITVGNQVNDSFAFSSTSPDNHMTVTPTSGELRNYQTKLITLKTSYSSASARITFEDSRGHGCYIDASDPEDWNVHTYTKTGTYNCTILPLGHDNYRVSIANY